MKNNEQYMPLGGVRGLAIIWVSLFYRYILLLGWPFQHRPTVLYNLAWDGYLMVEIFFFLSGYFSFIKYSNIICQGNITFHHYFLNKIKKFFPLMILTAFVTTGIQIIGKIIINDYGFSNTISLSGLILSCLGLQSGYFNDGGIYSNPVEWYICILLINYVIFYEICKLQNSTLKILFFVLWTIIGCAIMLEPYNWIGGYVSNGRGYFGFGYGCIFANFYSAKGETNKKLRIMFSYITIIVVTTIWILQPEYIGNKSIVIVLIICPTLFILTVESKIMRKLFTNKLLLLTGQWAYHIYLWSFPVDIIIYIVLNYYLKTDLINTIYMWLLSGMIILFLSYVSYEWIDPYVRKIIVSLKYLLK